MQLFFQEDISANSFELGPEESRHLVKVMRKSVGDFVHFTNGRGILFLCKIESLHEKKTRLTVQSQEFQAPENHYIHLAIAPIKNQDRMEWMVEKITEIGFHELTFLSTDNTEKNVIKFDRLEKKIISACKQSLKLWRPKLNVLRDYFDFIRDPSFTTSQKFIGYVGQENQYHLMDQAAKQASYLVLIGPEGDFSPNEIQQAIAQDFKPFSLGKSRLRTETAGLVAVNTLNLINR